MLFAAKTAPSRQLVSTYHAFSRNTCVGFQLLKDVGQFLGYPLPGWMSAPHSGAEGLGPNLAARSSPPAVSCYQTLRSTMGHRISNAALRNSYSRRGGSLAHSSPPAFVRTRPRVKYPQILADSPLPLARTAKQVLHQALHQATLSSTKLSAPPGQLSHPRGNIPQCHCFTSCPEVCRSSESMLQWQGCQPTADPGQCNSANNNTHKPFVAFRPQQSCAQPVVSKGRP